MNRNNLKKALSVFRTFLKFGCFTFGGGFSIVAQIQREYVEKKGWITEEELLDFMSVSRTVPGLMIGNTSVLFGYHAAGVPGALAALLGMVIPPVIIMLGVVVVYDRMKDNLYVARAMIGVRASVVPVIFSALLNLFKPGMKDAFCYAAAATAFGLCLFTGMSKALVMLMGALAGLLYMEARNRHDLS